MIELEMREWVVLSFITHYIECKEYAPYYREIEVGCGIRSQATLYAIRKKLQEVGLVSWIKGAHNTLRVHKCAVMVVP